MGQCLTDKWSTGTEVTLQLRAALVAPASACLRLHGPARFPPLRSHAKHGWTRRLWSFIPSVSSNPSDIVLRSQPASRWLGQNSKQGKLQRQLTDIQIRMRLRVSGSRQEIREQYMPMLANRIVLPLVNQGQVGELPFAIDLVS